MLSQIKRSNKLNLGQFSLSVSDCSSCKFKTVYSSNHKSFETWGV